MKKQYAAAERGEKFYTLFFVTCFLLLYLCSSKPVLAAVGAVWP